MRLVSMGRQAGRLATNMPTFISAQAQARISPRFCRSLFGSFKPMRNLRRTIGAIEALSCICQRHGQLPAFFKREPENILYGRALEEEVHSRPAHDDRTRQHAYVDDHLDPFLAACDSNQGKSDAALDSDEGEAPRLLENVEPLVAVNSSSR
ncbi:hypothetical protein IG631_17629 [Alternaria alternata]|nr:hypothetical protein IG631_17629 [Alternaria alternata]